MKKLLYALLFASACAGVVSMYAMPDPDEPMAKKGTVVQKTTDEEDRGDIYDDEFSDEDMQDETDIE